MRVPIKVWIDGDVYRQLLGHARARDMGDVGTLLARLAETSLRPLPESNPRRRKYTHITKAMIDAAHDLRGRGWSWREIEERLDVSATGMRRAMEREEG